MKIEDVQKLESHVFYFERLEKLRDSYPLRNMAGIQTDLADEMDKILEEIQSIDDGITKIEEQAV